MAGDFPLIVGTSDTPSELGRQDIDVRACYGRRITREFSEQENSNSCLGDVSCTSQKGPRSPTCSAQVAPVLLGGLAGSAAVLLIYRTAVSSHWFTRSGSALVLLTDYYIPDFMPSFFIVAAISGFVLWKVPVWQVRTSLPESDEKHFDKENEARNTLAQILGGAFVLISLYTSTKSFELAREGQMTDRFTKAIEQLGAADNGRPKLHVRLGGIYALTRIAGDSPKDQPAIERVLSAYLQTHSPSEVSPIANPSETPVSAALHVDDLGPDIRAILSFLVNRNALTDDPLDLRSTDLRGAQLNHIYLFEANLSRAYLNRAKLAQAILVDSDLTYASLVNADMRLADLRGARIKGANRSFADMGSADLSGANLEDRV